MRRKILVSLTSLALLASPSLLLAESAKKTGQIAERQEICPCVRGGQKIQGQASGKGA